MGDLLAGIIMALLKREAGECAGKYHQPQVMVKATALLIEKFSGSNQHISKQNAECFENISRLSE